MDGFARYHSAVMSVLLHAQMVMNPFHVVYLAAEKRTVCRQRVQRVILVRRRRLGRRGVDRCDWRRPCRDRRGKSPASRRDIPDLVVADPSGQRRPLADSVGVTCRWHAPRCRSCVCRKRSAKQRFPYRRTELSKSWSIGGGWPDDDRSLSTRRLSSQTSSVDFLVDAAHLTGLVRLRRSRRLRGFDRGLRPGSRPWPAAHGWRSRRRRRRWRLDRRGFVRS